MEAEHVRDAEETAGGAWPVDGWLSGAPAGTGLYAQLKRNVLKDLGRPSRPPQPRATWPSSPRCSAPESSWVAMSVWPPCRPRLGVLLPYAPAREIRELLDSLGIGVIWPFGDGFRDTAGGAFTGRQHSESTGVGSLPSGLVP